MGLGKLCKVQVRGTYELFSTAQCPRGHADKPCQVQVNGVYELIWAAQPLVTGSSKRDFQHAGQRYLSEYLRTLRRACLTRGLCSCSGGARCEAAGRRGGCFRRSVKIRRPHGSWLTT